MQRDHSTGRQARRNSSSANLPFRKTFNGCVTAVPDTQHQTLTGGTFAGSCCHACPMSGMGTKLCQGLSSLGLGVSLEQSLVGTESCGDSSILSAWHRVALQEQPQGQLQAAQLPSWARSWPEHSGCTAGVSRSSASPGGAGSPTQMKQTEQGSQHWCFSLFRAEFGHCLGCWSPWHQDESGTAGSLAPAHASGLCGGRPSSMAPARPRAAGSPGATRRARPAHRGTQHWRFSIRAAAALSGLSLASDTALLWLFLCFCCCTLWKISAKQGVPRGSACQPRVPQESRDSVEPAAPAWHIGGSVLFVQQRG